MYTKGHQQFWISPHNVNSNSIAPFFFVLPKRNLIGPLNKEKIAESVIKIALPASLFLSGDIDCVAPP